MKTTVLYALLTITYDGTVHHDTGYKNLNLCLEARSLAMNGRTIAAQKQYEDEQKPLRKKEAEWQKSHPGAGHASPDFQPDFAMISGIKLAECIVEPPK